MAGRLASFELAGDRRQIFLDCYMRMTRNMLVAIEQRRFEDPEWVASLLHHFADYYFRALDSLETGVGEAPAVWTHANQAASLDSTTTLQNLLLGVNAHINYDLVFALADVLEPEWQNAPDLLKEMRFRDHQMVNTIIGETVDEVQDNVVERFSPLLDVIDTVGGPFDEWVASWFISVWRDDVWRSAVELLDCKECSDQENVRRRVELKAIERARLLLLT